MSAAGPTDPIPSHCCALPFTLNGVEHYKCFDNGTGLGCFYGDREWKLCLQPAGNKLIYMYKRIIAISQSFSHSIHGLSQNFCFGVQPSPSLTSRSLLSRLFSFLFPSPFPPSFTLNPAKGYEERCKRILTHLQLSKCMSRQFFSFVCMQCNANFPNISGTQTVNPLQYGRE